MATQKVPETPLPDPGQSDEAAHAAISRRFREHSVIEIEKGNRLQASEKIWATVTQQLKAVAEDRGWANSSHQHIRDVALQLFRETGDERIRLLFRSVESMHHNFYENEETWDTVEEAWFDAEELVEKLEAIRGQRPSRFMPRNESDQARLALLMGYDLRRLNAANRQAVLNRFPLGQPSEVGFSPNYGYRPPNGNGGNGGASAPRNPSGGPPPTPIVPGAGQITDMAPQQESAGGVTTETRRAGRRARRRPTNQSKTTTNKAPQQPKGRHSFLRKGEAKGRF